jgi:hypothetical protein
MERKLWARITSRISLPSPATCIALVALTGTALAATGTIVNIGDGAISGRLAHVTALGELYTYGRTYPTAPPRDVHVATYLAVGSSRLIGPTTAVLAINRFAAMNTALNRDYSNTDFRAGLYQAFGSDCSNSGPALSIMTAPVGATAYDSYETPLVLRPSGSTPYCVMVSVDYDDAGVPVAYYLPFFELSGYVVSGAFPAALQSPARSTPIGVVPMVGATKAK